MGVTSQTNYEEKSYWLKDYGDYQASPVYEGNSTADVVVIGGGFTGLNTAWEFKKDNPNARVVVLEAAVIGYGASGRNGGFSMKLFGLEPDITLLRWGKQRTMDSFQYMDRAVNYVRTLIENYKIQSDYQHSGMFRVSYSPKQLARAETTFELLQKLGAASDMNWVDQAKLETEFLSDKFLGGTFDSNCGILNPCKQVRELKRLALEAGVEIFELSPVTNIEPTHSKVLVSTQKGLIESDKIVIATNAYSRQFTFLPKLKNRQFPIWTYQIVTEPLTTAQWQSIGWNNRQSFEDNRQLVHYFRPTVDGRITMGGGDVITPNSETMERDFAPDVWSHCEQHLKWIYPQLKDVKVAFRWGGPVSVNVDMTPEIGFIGDNRIIYSTGCIGHGVSLTHLNGRLIADLLSENKTELTDFWIVNRKAIPLPGNLITYGAAKLIRAGLKTWDWWEERNLNKVKDGKQKSQKSMIYK